MQDITIARAETDLEWRPVLDGVHAYADLRRLGKRLAAERHVTDETIACLTGELERAIADVEKLTRERDEARAAKRFWKVCESEYPEEGWTVLEAATAEEAQRQYESSCGGRPDGVEPDEEWLTATPFTLEDLEAMDAENERLRAVLRLAEGPIAIAASYADQPCETMGMRVHAKDCARVLPEIRAALAGEGEAKRCAWTYDETHCAWDSSCGEKWILEDGGQNENRIRFCHGCSKPVEAKAWEEEVES